MTKRDRYAAQDECWVRDRDAFGGTPKMLNVEDCAKLLSQQERVIAGLRDECVRLTADESRADDEPPPMFEGVAYEMVERMIASLAAGKEQE